MTKLNLRRIVPDHERLPWWLGIAGYEDFGRNLVCYPLGLHLVVPILRRFWWALHGPSYVARMEMLTAERHYRAGWTACEREYQGRDK